MKRTCKADRTDARPAFSRIDLLVLIAIIVLLIATLLPTLARAREESRRSGCADNLSAIGKGCYTYGNQSISVWPGSPRPGGPYARYVKVMPSEDSVSSSLWELVTLGYTPLEAMICRSSTDTPMRIDDPTKRVDFDAYEHVSYGYQVPWGDKGRPNSDRDLRMPLAADKGPWGYYREKGITAIPQLNERWPTAGSPADAWGRFQSFNHGGVEQGEGQNCLYPDAHAEFRNKPTAGIAGDNIYTFWGNSLTDATPDPTGANRSQGTLPPPHTVTPTAATPYLPASNTDSFIYPWAG